MVYCIGNIAANVCKIGYSNNPLKRLAVLQTGSHYTLSLFAVREGDRKLERELHQELQEYRLAGEWFSLELPIIEYFDIDLDRFPQELVHEQPAVEETQDALLMGDYLPIVESQDGTRAFKVFLALAIAAPFNSIEVQVNKATKKQMQAFTRYPTKQLTATIESLVRHGFVRQKGDVYSIDPSIFFHGSPARHPAAIKRWNTNDRTVAVLTT